ncbi:MAG: glycosyltransferase family 4 protein [candidate division Zixibacteria bacterium]|nr:glycosyltransferase family 4 protein [candidate division Zixibacteria bacterium]
MNILTIANFVRRKRIDLCAKACKKLIENKNIADLSWTVIGRGPLEYEIKQIAPDSMEFISNVESLADYYRESDVFVLPSADEGFGMVYIEAIMCGCPVICRKNDGGEEIVNRTGGGIAIDVTGTDDQAVDNITSAIQTILESREGYSSDSTKRAAHEMVDPKHIRQEWVKILTD